MKDSGLERLTIQPSGRIEELLPHRWRPLCPRVVGIAATWGGQRMLPPDEAELTEPARIMQLIRDELVKIATDSSGWRVLYRDPKHQARKTLAHQTQLALTLFHRRRAPLARRGGHPALKLPNHPLIHRDGAIAL